MTERYLSLYDDRRGICARVEPRVADSLIATLSADPETIEEFERAMHRFFHPEYARNQRSAWVESTDTTRPQPWRATVSVDLPGRLLVSQPDPTRRGHTAAYFNSDGQPEAEFGYDLSSEWLVKQSETEERQLALSRREQRHAERSDVRRVLFDQPMIEFFAEQAEKAFADTQPSLPPDWSVQRKNLWFRHDGTVYQLTRRLHRDWLMSAHSELGGRRVRDAMLTDHEHIATDISHRITQWASQQECPPGLSRSDSAFAHGAFGVHEVILYYDVVRELLLYYFEQSIEHSGLRNGEVVLARRRDEWMQTPQSDALMGLTPCEAIERERLRIPLVQPEDHAVIDDDCPICRMSAELGLGPTFVYLDDLHFDDEFAFSRHLRREDWQREQAEFKAQRERYELQRERNSEAGTDSPSPADPVWQRVYVNQQSLGHSISEDVMALGFYLAELVDDVKRECRDEELAKQLNRHFDNLAPASRHDNRSMLQPVISRLGESIDEVAQQFPDLEPKCLDLQNHLARMAEMLEG